MGLGVRGLARMLRLLKVKSMSFRVGARAAKGHHIDVFADTFARHLPNAPATGHEGHIGHDSVPTKQAM
jgi:hypothetical protein